MIYMNNAATSYPKPDIVRKTVDSALASPPLSQYRGTSGKQTDYFLLCRNSISKLFHIQNPKRIYFTSGATESLNLVIRGLSLSNRHVIITETEHNSVLRPLFTLNQNHSMISVAECDSSGKVSPKSIRDLLRPDTAAVIINHCSNVTGAVQELAEIGTIVKQHGAVFIVDASQSAGAVPIHVDDMKIDALVFTGHKSLMGIQGTGGFWLREGICPKALIFGGTGRDSTVIDMRGTTEYEAGTANGPGIAALYAGVDYILTFGLDRIMHHEHSLMQILYKEMKKINGVIVYSDHVPEGPVLSFNIEGMPASDTSYILSNHYGIITRSGLQCAPLIHKRLKTEPYGTVRLSCSCFNTEEEAAQVIESIKKIAEALR